jgi:hypothetical protein
VVTLPPVIAGKSRELAAEAVQVGASSISRAKQVKDADPEAFNRLKRGETTVNTEYRKVRTTPEPKRESKATGKRQQTIENSANEIKGAAGRLLVLVAPSRIARCRNLHQAIHLMPTTTWAAAPAISQLRPLMGSGKLTGPLSALTTLRGQVGRRGGTAPGGNILAEIKRPAWPTTSH